MLLFRADWQPSNDLFEGSINQSAQSIKQRKFLFFVLDRSDSTQIKVEKYDKPQNEQNHN